MRIKKKVMVKDHLMANIRVIKKIMVKDHLIMAYTTQIKKAQ